MMRPTIFGAHLSAVGLNVRQPACFVLGGVVHDGPPRVIDHQPLMRALRMQKSAAEMKFRHIGKPGLAETLSSPRLEILLDWLKVNQLSIHLEAIDPVYWSLVDIVDSALVADPRWSGIAPLLKDDLYICLKADIHAAFSVFARFGYPDVGERRSTFMTAVRLLVQLGNGAIPKFRAKMLDDFLRMASGLEELPFLQDEKSGMLIDTFEHFYIGRIAMFRRSTHVLDQEDEIQAKLAERSFVDNGRELRSFRFADSRDEVGIQLSDVIVGLFGKLATCAIECDSEKLRDFIGGLDRQQRLRLKMLADLTESSMAREVAFVHRVLCLSDLQKMDRLLSGRMD